MAAYLPSNCATPTSVAASGDRRCGKPQPYSGGEVEFFGWKDLFYSFNDAGLQLTLTDWAKAEQGRDMLLPRFERVLRQHRFAVVFTLDPRHGSTCHPSHRAAALLLLEAVQRLEPAKRPILWLEQTDNIDERSETVAAVNARLGYPAWPDTGRDTVYYDASKRLRNGAAAYDYALAARRLHKSQFPDEATGKVGTTASKAEQRVPLAPLGSFKSDDYCTPLKLRRPTLDILENRKRLGVD